MVFWITFAVFTISLGVGLLNSFELYDHIGLDVPPTDDLDRLVRESWQ